tara:strand:- start:120 stop:494 length:375 start_codon:yes stop_codon:yes gene_type:complete
MKAITIAGRLTKDSEIKTGGMDQSQFVTFSVAVDDGYGAKKSTIFFDCSYFGKRATGVQPYLKKGTSLCVSGELTQREYNGKTYLGVRVNDLTLQGGKSASNNSQPQAQYQAPASVDLDDDIPF